MEVLNMKRVNAEYLAQKAIVDYLAQKLVDDLRAGQELPVELQRAYSSVLADAVRKQIQPADWKWIRSMCNSPSEYLRRLAIDLTRNIRDLPEVRPLLEDMWRQQGLPVSVRIALQARLLDYEDLTEEWHRELFKFTLNNWEEYLQEVRQWVAASGPILNFCRQRLNDPNFPRSKRWFYICNAAAADDPKEAREFIENYKNDEDPFVREVVEGVLRRLAASPNS